MYDHCIQPRGLAREMEGKAIMGKCKRCVDESTMSSTCGAKRSHCEPLSRNPETAYVQQERACCGKWP
jgi:hypothetical protein